jgi:hypothetical protein
LQEPDEWTNATRLAAAAPTGAVLIAASAGSGVAFALLLGLSLATTNAVFPPQRRAAAIALYLGAGFAFTTPMPAVGSLLAETWAGAPASWWLPSRRSSRW